MVHVCNNKYCENFKAEKTYQTSQRYIGQSKRCNICSIFIKWEGIWCPCCGSKLKTKPKSMTSRIGKISCSLCNGIMSFWGKIAHWMKNEDGEVICVACFDERNGVNCTECKAKESKSRDGRPHFYRPKLGVTLCRKCYEKYKRERQRELRENRSIIQSTHFVN